MKNYKNLSAFLLVLFMCALFPVTVLANSSWGWISETRPLDVLPFVILGTLLIEIFAITFIPKIQNLSKVIFIVTVANIISFIMPYVGGMFDEIYSLAELLESSPFYTVGAVFVFMTIIAELPIIYFSFCKEVKSKKILLCTIVAVNVITTFLVAIVERTLCYGHW